MGKLPTRLHGYLYESTNIFSSRVGRSGKEFFYTLDLNLHDNFVDTPFSSQLPLHSKCL